MEIRKQFFPAFSTSTLCTWLPSSRTVSDPNSLCRANSGKLRRGRSSLPLSSRSAVSYTGFSFLALSMLKMCKTKRLLSVHPFDFELDSDYSAQSRRQSLQLSPAASSPDAFQVLGDSWGGSFPFFLLLLATTAPSASEPPSAGVGRQWCQPLLPIYLFLPSKSFASGQVRSRTPDWSQDEW